MADKNSGDRIMKISARNQIKGTVRKIEKGATTSHVSIEIAGGAIVMASITNEAVADLGLKDGESVYAVIKASDVMVGVD
jgi:molybdopterin-binding protein